MGVHHATDDSTPYSVFSTRYFARAQAVDEAGVVPELGAGDAGRGNVPMGEDAAIDHTDACGAVDFLLCIVETIDDRPEHPPEDRRARLFHLVRECDGEVAGEEGDDAIDRMRCRAQ